MAVCAFCGKKRTIGHNVSHANNKTGLVIMPNLQRICVVTKTGVRRLSVCTRCLRSGKVKKAV